MPHLGNDVLSLWDEKFIPNIPHVRPFPTFLNFVFSSQNPFHILTIEFTPKNERDYTVDNCIYEFHKNGVSSL